MSSFYIYDRSEKMIAIVDALSRKEALSYARRSVLAERSLACPGPEPHPDHAQGYGDDGWAVAKL